MGAIDYKLCDACSAKCFYDADLQYDFKGFPDTGFDRLGAWKVLCRRCATSRAVVIVPSVGSDPHGLAAAIADEFRNDDRLGQECRMSGAEFVEVAEVCLEPLRTALTAFVESGEFLQDAGDARGRSCIGCGAIEPPLEDERHATGCPVDRLLSAYAAAFPREAS